MFSWGEALLFAKPAEEPASVLVRGPSGTAVDRAADTNDDGGDDAERGGGGSKGVGGGVRADRLSDALLGSSAAPASAAIAMDGGGRGEESALESAGGTPRFCHSAASSAPSGMAAGGGGLLDASISTDSLADGAASVWSGVGAGGNAAGAQLRRQRFRTAAVRARPGDDSVLIRRSDSFAYSQRRLSRSASTLLAGMSEAAVARTAADDEGFARELRDDELVPPTLSYMEIQQAASRVGLEVTRARARVAAARPGRGKSRLQPFQRAGRGSGTAARRRVGRGTRAQAARRDQCCKMGGTAGVVTRARAARTSPRGRGQAAHADATACRAR